MFGRNKLCPCGSNNKFKKCCMKKYTERNMVGVESILDWISKQQNLRETFEELLLEHNVKDKLHLSLLFDAFIFDYVTSNRDTPFERFMKQTNQQQMYTNMAKQKFSLFQIKEIDRGKWMEVQDIYDNKTYYLIEKKGSKKVKKGSIISLRLVKSGFFCYNITPMILQIPDEVVFGAKQLMKDFNTRLSSFQLIEAFFAEEQDPVDEFKRHIKQLRIPIDPETIHSRINSNKTPEEAFQEVYKFKYSSRKDFKETIRLLIDMWNAYPREEFNGKSPSEMIRMGVIEKSLIQVCLHEAQKEITPENYPKKSAAEQAIKQFIEKWLDKPQKELGNMKPRTKILEERKELGITEKKIDCCVELSHVENFDTSLKERLYDKGLDALKNGELNDSEKSFKLCLEKDPNFYKAWVDLGVSYCRQHQFEKAKNCFECALEIQPDCQAAAKNLLRIKRRRK